MSYRLPIKKFILFLLPSLLENKVQEEIVQCCRILVCAENYEDL